MVRSCLAVWLLAVLAISAHSSKSGGVARPLDIQSTYYCDQGSSSKAVSYSTPLGCTCSPPSGSNFPIGTNTVTCTSLLGLLAPTSFPITILPYPGSTPSPTPIYPTPTPTPTPVPVPAPTHQTLPDVSSTCAPGESSRIVSYPAPSGYTCSPASGSSFPIGTTPVTGHDSNGNTCSFYVIVVPNSQPKILNDVTSTAPTGSQSCNVNYNTPSGYTCSPPSGSSFACGTTPVSCRNAAGSSCAFNVIVIPAPAPVPAPAPAPAPITLPDVTSTATAGSPSCIVPYTPPSNAICSPAPGFGFPVGTTTVSCFDRVNTLQKYFFSCIVLPAPSAPSPSLPPLPSVAPPDILCPNDLYSNAGQGTGSILATYSAGAPSGCLLSYSPPSGSHFGLGSNTVTCTATDLATGLTNSCTFKVIVGCVAGCTNLSGTCV